MRLIHTVILSLVTSLVLVPSASAACTLDSIRGKFAGEYYFPEDSRYWATTGALMVRFDGNGKIIIIKASEGSDDQYGVERGTGTYTLRSDCTGTARLTIKSGSQITGRGKLDFYVGGTKNNQEIFGSYQDTDLLHSGSIRLIRSHL